MTPSSLPSLAQRNNPRLGMAMVMVSTVLLAPPPDWPDGCLLAATGLIGDTRQYFMTRALEVARAAVIGPFNYVSLLWAALFGWLSWGEIPPAHVFAGSAVVVASGLFVFYCEVRQARRRLPTA